MGLRGDAIVQFDWSVGEIMKTLDRLGLTENTLIILSSDNGPVLDDGYDDKAVELAGSHKPGGPFRGGKYSAFEAGTCVPAIVRYPAQVKKNQTLNTLLSQIDWIQSLASLVNVTIPQSKAPDSQNHLDSWLGKSKKIVLGLSRNLIFWHYPYAKENGNISNLPMVPHDHLGSENRNRICTL